MRLLKWLTVLNNSYLKNMVVLWMMLLTNLGYAQKLTVLKEELNALKFDSVKVFSFNCSSKVKIEDYGLLNDTSLITSKQQWAYTISEKSRFVYADDLKFLLKTLIANESMKKYNDPVGCYQPRLGFAFFLNNSVVGHIDICLECNKSILEIFKVKGPSFRYFFKTFRYGIKDKLSTLCVKYNMECCSPN